MIRAMLFRRFLMLPGRQDLIARTVAGIVTGTGAALRAQSLPLALLILVMLVGATLGVLGAWSLRRGGSPAALKLFVAVIGSIPIALLLGPLQSGRHAAFVLLEMSVAVAATLCLLWLAELRSQQPTWLTGVAILAAAATIATAQLRNDPSGELALAVFSSAVPLPAVEFDSGTGFSPVHAFELSNPAAAAVLRIPRTKLEVAFGGVATAYEPGALSARILQDRITLERLSTPLLLELSAPSVELQSTIGGSRRLEPPAVGVTWFLLLQPDGEDIAVAASTSGLTVSGWAAILYRIRSLRISFAEVLQTPDAADVVLYDRLSGRLHIVNTRIDETRSALVTEGSLGMRQPTRALRYSMVLGGVIAGALVWSAGAGFYKVTRSWRRLDRKARRWMSAGLSGLALAFGAILFVIWPGTFGWDAFSPFLQRSAGDFVLWYGLGYPLLVTSFSYLGGPGIIVFVQCTVLFALLAGLMLWAERLGVPSPVAALLPLGLLLATSMVFIATHHLRDAMMAITIAAFLVLVFRAVLEPEVQHRPWIGITVFATLCVILRNDAGAIVVPALIAAALLHRRGRLTSTALATVSLAVAFGANMFAERLLVPNAAAERLLYQETAFINPLIGMASDPVLRAQSDPDLVPVLDRLMDAEDAIRRWSPYHVVPWHETLSHRPYPTPEALAELRRMFVSQILAHPSRFLLLRAETFAGSLGHPGVIAVAGVTEEWPDTEIELFDHVLQGQGVHRTFLHALGVPDSAKSGPRRALVNWFQSIHTTMPQVLVAIVAVLLIPWLPASGLIGFCLLAHAAVFFVFAPASVLLYLGGVHVTGSLLPMLMLIEWWARAGRRSCH